MDTVELIERLEQSTIPTTAHVRCPECGSDEEVRTLPGSGDSTPPYFCTMCGHDGEDADYVAS